MQVYTVCAHTHTHWNIQYELWNGTFISWRFVMLGLFSYSGDCLRLYLICRQQPISSLKACRKEQKEETEFLSIKGFYFFIYFLLIDRHLAPKHLGLVAFRANNCLTIFPTGQGLPRQLDLRFKLRVSWVVVFLCLWPHESSSCVCKVTWV